MHINSENLIQLEINSAKYYFWQLIKTLSMIPNPRATWFFKVKFSSAMTVYDTCQKIRAMIAAGNFPKIKYQYPSGKCTCLGLF